jgi:hypothetical protein
MGLDGAAILRTGLRQGTTGNSQEWILPTGWRESDGVSAPGLSVRPYFHRYTEDAIALVTLVIS